MAYSNLHDKFAPSFYNYCNQRVHTGRSLNFIVLPIDVEQVYLYRTYPAIFDRLTQSKLFLNRETVQGYTNLEQVYRALFA